MVKKKAKSRGAGDNRSAPLRAPFRYSGSKRRVAGVVWQAFGDVDTYIEPFGGSMAVLLARPENHTAKREVVNDADGYIVNFYRAVRADPDAVASFAHWPRTEIDYIARHLWLVNEGRQRLKRLAGDPDYYDPKVAGWWLWGKSMGITRLMGQFCMGHGTHGKGVDGRVYRAGKDGRGPIGQALSPGRIPMNKLELLSDVGWFALRDPVASLRRIARRLERVRILYGDWRQAAPPSLLRLKGDVGLFLDPPYRRATRAMEYPVDAANVDVVRDWAVKIANDFNIRVAFCGLDYEHAGRMPKDWSAYRWVGGGWHIGSASTLGRENEVVWFSPNCNPIEDEEA